VVNSAALVASKPFTTIAFTVGIVPIIAAIAIRGFVEFMILTRVKVIQVAKVFTNK